VSDKFINSIKKLLKLNFYMQLVLLFLVSVIFIYVFNLILDSVDVSIGLFFDPTTYSEVLKTHPFLGILEIIIGIILSSALISAITSAVMQWTEKARIHEVHHMIKDAFEGHSLIRVRKLLKENNLIAKRKDLLLTEAELRLELPKEDIIQAIQTFKGLRLRMLKVDKSVIIEDFEENASYGVYQNKDSKITIISTQNYSEAGVGHFAYTLSQNLNANYISNEFYSSGALLKEKQINFSANEKYLDFSPSKKEVFNEWLNDIKEVATISDTIFYIGTSSDKWDNDVHLLFGGKKGQSGFDVENPIYDDLEKLEDFYNALKSDLGELGFNVGTHENFGNTNKKHLSQAMHNNFDTNVVVLYISTKILWLEEDELYYKTIISFINNIKKYLLKVEK